MSTEIGRRTVLIGVALASSGCLHTGFKDSSPSPGFVDVRVVDEDELGDAEVLEFEAREFPSQEVLERALEHSYQETQKEDGHYAAIATFRVHSESDLDELYEMADYESQWTEQEVFFVRYKGQVFEVAPQHT